jgi:hypothetical protein
MNRGDALRRLAEGIRRKHPALATATGHFAWLRRYCDYLKGLPSHLPSEQKLDRFLTDLATKHVAASTQNQALVAKATKSETVGFRPPGWDWASLPAHFPTRGRRMRKRFI